MVDGASCQDTQAAVAQDVYALPPESPETRILPEAPRKRTVSAPQPLFAHVTSEVEVRDAYTNNQLVTVTACERAQVSRGPYFAGGLKKKEYLNVSDSP